MAGSGLLSSSNQNSKKRGRQTSPLLAPWLATGIGLAALSAIGDGSLSEPADAAPPPVVAGTGVFGDVGAAERMGAALRATSTPDATDPVLTSADVRRTAAYEGGPPMSTRASELFAVNGNLVKPLPPDYHHDLVSDYRPMPTAEAWEALRQCEASGDYQVVNFSGRYRGAYQFDLETWATVGGTGDPIDASPAEQDHRALRLYLERGHAPWPECGRFLPQD